MIRVREGSREDTGRILEISAQIWDGHDYVPLVLEEWLAASDGELLVAEVDGVLAGFAYRTWLFPGHAWLQGIRTDPAFRGRGVGRALSLELIDRSRRDGASHISLSTYFDNEPSIRIVESLGFRRVASFVYLERRTDDGPLPATMDPGIDVPTKEETERFVSASPYLATARGWYPVDWVFLPFHDRPRAFVEKTPYRMGVRKGRVWRSLLCAAFDRGSCEPAFLSFLDGDPGDFPALFERASRDLAATAWESMVPKSGSDVAPALASLRALGFTPWQDGNEDVYCYDLASSDVRSPRR
jgi:GNAT superfamily N-acetyltransferase